MKNRLPHVALMFESVYTQHQEMLHGILRFSKTHGPWAVSIVSGRHGDADLARLEKWGCDGIIASRINGNLARFARRHKIPTCQISVISPKNADITTACDNETIGQTAADYLLSRGFTSFAFVGDTGRGVWSLARERTFCRALKRKGFPCRVAAGDDGTELGLLRFLKSLPKPTAVFAAFDLRARQVLDACAEVGLRVPQDVSILGVDNEEMICETSSPTLSSIPLSTEEAGFRAAEALDRLILGSKPKTPLCIVFTGDHVVERDSTQRLKKDDWLVQRCIEIIAANTDHALTTSDLVNRLKVSRRTLEIRFREATGTTLAQASVLARLNRARLLLSDPARTQEEVALACGFCDASHLNRLFRRQFGVPPSTFRKTQRKAFANQSGIGNPWVHHF